MAATQLSTTTAIRAYRVYLRDAQNHIARSHDVDLSCDVDAHQLAVLMLDKLTDYPSVKVWDRARLVCVVRRSE
jgi:hypothetical protein